MNAALIFALVLAAAAWFFVSRTFAGYRMRVAGLAPAAAAYAGYSDKRNIWLALLISGGAAGLAGVSEVAGPVGLLSPAISPGYGFAAIIVAFVGRLHPLGVVLASLLMSALYLGGEAAQIELQLPASDHQPASGRAVVLSAGRRPVHHVPAATSDGSAACADGRTHHHSRQHHAMTFEQLLPILASTVTAATPLIIAALGVLVSERAGVLNLGVEGMMLIGAVIAFAVGVSSGSLLLGYLAAISAGAAVALIFAVLVLSLQTNQVATGLALALFGVGLSAFLGRSFVGTPIERLPALDIPLLSDIPLLGPLLFHYDAVVYGSLLLFAGVSWFLYRSRLGLRLRAIGEAPAVAHSLGEPVIRIRYLATLFGGAMSGLAGAYLSTALTPMWVEGMSAGRGLDRTCSRCVCDLASASSPARRLSIRRRHGVTTARARLWSQRPKRVPVDAALPGHHRRARIDLPRSQGNPAQPAGLVGPQLSPGRLDGSLSARMAQPARPVGAPHHRHRVDRRVVLFRLAGQSSARACQQERGGCAASAASSGPCTAAASIIRRNIGWRRRRCRARCTGSIGKRTPPGCPVSFCCACCTTGRPRST